MGKGGSAGRKKAKKFVSLAKVKGFKKTSGKGLSKTDRRSSGKSAGSVRKKGSQVINKKELIEKESEFPPAPVSFAPSSGTFELPATYGDNKIVLLVRDPWWLYTYWEVTPERQAQTLEEMRREGCTMEKMVLRVYDVTGASMDSPRSFFDIEIAFLASNWYIDVGIPDREWVVELGLRAPGGRFFPIVRSNIVRTPRFGISDVLDEEWMLPDELYWKLFGLAGGLADRRSSLDVRDILEKYLKSIVSSEGASSFSHSAKMLRNESRVDVNAKILENL